MNRTYFADRSDRSLTLGALPCSYDHLVSSDILAMVMVGHRPVHLTLVYAESVGVIACEEMVPKAYYFSKKVRQG